MKPNIVTWLIFGPICALVIFTIFKPQIIKSDFVPIKHDPRIFNVGQFMLAHHFIGLKAEDFLFCSDKYDIDYRVLPVIAFKESSGGIHFTPGTNNPMGMIYSENGKDYLKTYPSTTDAICASAALLAHLSPTTLEGKIKKYNSVNPDYWPETQTLMNEIK